MSRRRFYTAKLSAYDASKCFPREIGSISAVKNDRNLLKRISVGSHGCYLCGEAATTRDHLPPLCFFPKPLPDNLITLPCCESCNNIASIDDERSRFLFALDAYQKAPGDAKEYWLQVLIHLRDNRPKTLELIERNISNINIIDPESGVLGNLILLPTIHYYNVFRRMVKGLYYLDLEKRLPANIQVIVKRGYFKGASPTALLPENLHRSVSIGPMEAFWTYASDEDTLSFWRFDFYGVHHAIAYTLPQGIPDIFS